MYCAVFVLAGIVAGQATTVRAADDIVDTAVSAGSFNTLVAAVQAAGLVDALKGGDPFTVFAPTDEAFSELPEGTVESLLKPENKEQLANIPRYHVIAGRVYSDAAVDGREAKTLLGQNLRVSVGDGVAKINDAKLLATDIDASNGAIHVIDAVLLPQDKVSAQGHGIVGNPVLRLDGITDDVTSPCMVDVLPKAMGDNPKRLEL